MKTSPRPGFAARFLGLTAVFLLTVAPAFAAFGLTTTTSAYTVDTGAGLVFKVDRANGGIPSIVWNGTELNNTTKPSGIASGLGATGTTVSAVTSGTNIIVTVTTDSTNGVVAGLTQYYVVQSGVNTIYMATYATNEPAVGELRWITRLQGGLFTSVPAQSEIRLTDTTVESSDVFGIAASGYTYSKYYGNQRAKDLSIRGVAGSGRGVFMAYGNRESSSGGPFFRDIQNQTGSDAEVYNYMNSGHNQTEAYRLGVLHGPYALCFTTGATPAVPDMSFLANLGLTGYVNAAGRGRVILNGLAGRDTAYTYTVGFSNATAQYWVTAAAANGAAGCYNMKPGTYTMTVYKNELAVYTESVTAGNPTTLNTRTISGDPSAVTPLWRIGNWDGTPLEFRNGTNIPLMHPSDTRQGSWVPGTFVVGTSAASSFPACQWKDINNPQTITFTLTSAQLAARTVRVGITGAYAGGRPKITINNWSSSNPSASGQPDSRSMTIGTYRGNNTTYTFSVPASAFVAGVNTLYVVPISGSGATGYLSAGYSIDCVDLY